MIYSNLLLHNTFRDTAATSPHYRFRAALDKGKRAKMTKKGARKGIFLIGEYENDKKAITKDNCLNDVKLKCYDSRILKQII